MGKRLIMPGGAGYLGRHLSPWFAARGWDVTVLSRRAEAVEGAKVITWDGKSLGSWAAAVDGADVVLNLAGRTVNCRYTAANRA
jgi:uncharacterized protein